MVVGGTKNEQHKKNTNGLQIQVGGQEHISDKKDKFTNIIVYHQNIELMTLEHRIKSNDYLIELMMIQNITLVDTVGKIEGLYQNTQCVIRSWCKNAS